MPTQTKTTGTTSAIPSPRQLAQLQPRQRVFRDIDAEWRRAVAIHGPGHHRDGTHPEYERLATLARQTCEERFAKGEGTWLDILREEFYELASETDWTKLRPELVQAAQVIVAWIQDGDERAAQAH